MAARAKLRDDRDRGPFEGRVRKWSKKWVPYVVGSINGEVRLELLRWMQTDQQCPSISGPRHPNIRPVQDTRVLTTGFALDSAPLQPLVQDMTPAVINLSSSPGAGAENQSQHQLATTVLY